MNELPKISSLWIGPELTWLEQLCMKSFADAGHEITLYSYDPIKNLPKGVKAGNAEDIFPREPMLRHARTGSPAIHADMWRLHLLQKTDEIWVDADMYCAHPFDFVKPFVFGWEKKPHLVCNAVLGLPNDSETLGALIEFFKDPYAIAPWLNKAQIAELEAERDAGTPIHITEQNWGFTGPASVTYFLKETGEIKYAQEEVAFYPLSFKIRNHLILTRKREDVMKEVRYGNYGIHFWARRMKPRLQEKENNRPRKNSFMDKLLELHEINPDDAPIPAKIVRQNYDPNDKKLRNDIKRLHFVEGYSVDKICRKFLVEKKFVKSCISQN